VVDNWGVDRERAETHLRRVAEAELRRAIAARAGDGGAPHSLEQLLKARQAAPASRITQIARALTAVGALDVDVASTIRENFALAFALRQPMPLHAPDVQLPAAVRRQVGLMRAATDRRGTVVSGAGGGSLTSAASAPGQAREADGVVTARVVPIGMMVPVTSEVAHGEMYLLAYSHNGSSARITIVARLRGQLWGGNPAGVFGLESAAAIDDKGNSYQVYMSGGGRDSGEWTGELTLDPEPPPDIRWLDIPADDEMRRIPLELEHPLPDVEFTPGTHTPGEHYLHGIAAQIFCGLPVLTHKLRTQAPTFRPVLPDHLTDGLGDIVAALQSAGALSPLSQVPAQLVTLCESLNITNHGITEQPTLDLPDPWLSLLTHYHRRKPETVLPGSGIAGAAVILPELDGLTLAILGLHNGSDGSIMHVQVTGLTSDGPDLPLLWIRDEGGRWHTSRRSFSSQLSDSEMIIRLEIFPPLPRTRRIEILAACRTAQARTEVPLRWT
jgi:hypothetical protein